MYWTPSSISLEKADCVHTWKTQTHVYVLLPDVNDFYGHIKVKAGKHLTITMRMMAKIELHQLFFNFDIDL